MLYLDGVPHGVDVRERGLHPVVDHNTAPEAQLQPRLLGQGGVRSDADGQGRQVGVEGFPVLQQHVHAAVPGLKARHGAAQGQPDSVFPHLAVEEGRHVGVEGAHQLGKLFYDGDLQPQLPQVLRQLHPDEAAAHQHCGFGAGGADVVLEAEGVLHRPQGEDPVQINPRDGGLGGLRAGGEDQLVVGLLEHLSCFQVFHGDGFAIRMDGGDLVAHPHLHLEAGIEALRGLEGEGVPVLNGPANIVGQAAVGVGDMA